MKSYLPAPAAASRNLKPFENFRQFCFYLARHPFFISLFAFPIILKATGIMRLEFPQMTVIQEVILLLCRFGAYFVALLVLFPSWLYFWMNRNVSFMLTYWAFWMMMCLVNLIVSWLFFAQYSALELMARFVATQMMAAMLVVWMVYFFERAVRAQLGFVPELVPVWKSVIMPENGALSASMLAPELSGNLLLIQAQNQYLKVKTSTGTKLLRMTMKDALSRLPNGTGIRVHRSWWLHRSLIVAPCKDGNKLTVIDGQGNAYPSSKELLVEIEKYAEENRQLAAISVAL